MCWYRWIPSHDYSLTSDTSTRRTREKGFGVVACLFSMMVE